MSEREAGAPLYVIGPPGRTGEDGSGEGVAYATIGFGETYIPGANLIRSASGATRPAFRRPLRLVDDPNV
jgi:hypothetical protein